MFSQGIDIIEISRFTHLKHNKRFLDRIYTKQEQEYCFLKDMPEQRLATRFAAKEATWKALSFVFVHDLIAFKAIEVCCDMHHKPFIQLPQHFSYLVSDISLSLSHSKYYAVASALYISKGIG